MTPLFKKLNLKETHQKILILNAPESFQPEIAEISKNVTVTDQLNKAETVGFVMVFVTLQAEIDAITPVLAAQLQEDGILWFCYPKGSSKKYICNFNRDTGWSIPGTYGFEPVRMVAIDEDWSALRFRQVQHIKKMTRGSAITTEGKAKAGIK